MLRSRGNSRWQSCTIANALLLAVSIVGAVVLLPACDGSNDDHTQKQTVLWRVVARSERIVSLAFSDESTGWAVSLASSDSAERRQVRITDDGGYSWESCKGVIDADSTAQQDGQPRSIAQLRLPAQVLCVGRKVLLTHHASSSGQGATAQRQASGILASSDGGLTWRPILSLTPSHDSVLWLSAGDSDHFWALCGTGKPQAPTSTYLLASGDGGRSWARLPQGRYGIPAHCSSTLCSAPLVFVDGCAGWSLYRPSRWADDTEPWQSISTTHDGGRTWTSAEPSVSPDELGIFCGFCALDEQRAWANLQRAGTRSALLSTSDGGQTWSRTYVDELSLLGVHFDDTEHGWVVANVGRRNRLLATSDGGRRWNTEITLSSGVSGRVEEWVFCTAGERLFASNGMVLLSREMPEVHD